jgi:hypothetical protein
MVRRLVFKNRKQTSISNRPSKCEKDFLKEKVFKVANEKKVFKSQATHVLPISQLHNSNNNNNNRNKKKISFGFVFYSFLLFVVVVLLSNFQFSSLK